MDIAPAKLVYVAVQEVFLSFCHWVFSWFSIADNATICNSSIVIPGTLRFRRLRYLRKREWYQRKLVIHNPGSDTTNSGGTSLSKVPLLLAEASSCSTATSSSDNDYSRGSEDGGEIRNVRASPTVKMAKGTYKWPIIQMVPLVLTQI